MLSKPFSPTLKPIVLASCIYGLKCLRENRKTQQIPSNAKAREGRLLNVSPAQQGWDINHASRAP